MWARNVFFGNMNHLVGDKNFCKQYKSKYNLYLTIGIEQYLTGKMSEMINAIQQYIQQTYVDKLEQLIN